MTRTKGIAKTINSIECKKEGNGKILKRDIANRKHNDKYKSKCIRNLDNVNGKTHLIKD